jgi:mannitol/fructose-specific phosphotransferase system IIA component (Ntr-type)
MIALPVFLHYEFEEAQKSNKIFMIKAFNSYFSNKKSECEKIKILFAKLVKNDNHVDFSKRLFAFLKNDFKRSKIVDFDNKSQVMNFIYYIVVFKIYFLYFILIKNLGIYR